MDFTIHLTFIRLFYTSSMAYRCGTFFNQSYFFIFYFFNLQQTFKIPIYRFTCTLVILFNHILG